MSFLPPIVFAFYGSSLTTGRLSADWVPRLLARLKDEPEALGEVIVYNLGKGSQTSDWGLANAPGISALKPTHILFEGFAINDCAIGPVSLAAAASNFNGMVSEWRSNIPGVDLTHHTMSPAAAADVNRVNLQTYYTQELARATALGVTSINHTPGWPAITEANTQGAGFRYAIPSGFSAWGATAFDPAAKNANLTLSNNNHSVVSAVIHGGIRATTGQSAGNRYFETIATFVDSTGNMTGIETAAHSLADGAWVGSGATGYGYSSGGIVYNNGGTIATYAPIVTGDVVNVAVDFSALKIWFGRNGNWNGDPVAGTGGLAIAAGTYFPAWSGAINTTGDTADSHFNSYDWGGDSLHPIWSGVFETYPYPVILAWAKAKMGAFW